MENKKNIEDFLISLNDTKIITIGGDAASGKSWMSSIICEYFILKNKNCLIIDISNDGMLMERLSNSSLIKNSHSNIRSVNLYTFETIFNLLKTTNNTTVVIENIGDIPTPNTNDVNSIGNRAKYMRSFLRQISEIQKNNNLNIIITANTYTNFINNSSTLSNSLTYISDVIGICYKNKITNALMFKIEKSRMGNYLDNSDIINISYLIKSTVRREKIQKLLQNN